MILVLFDVISVGMASIRRADCSVRIAMAARFGRAAAAGVQPTERVRRGF